MAEVTKINKILDNIFTITAMLLLLCVTAIVAAAETAFFALDPQDIDLLKNSGFKKDIEILNVLERPKRLLASLLVGLNFVNIGIVILSTILVDALTGPIENDWARFFIQVVAVTLLILVIGEMIPKIYALQFPLTTARLLIFPTLFLERLFYPVASALLFFTNLLDSNVKKHAHSISVEELSHALEITTHSEDQQEDKKMLQGIVKFGETDVKQIMQGRMDVVTFNCNLPFRELIAKVEESIYSRIPIYKESIDAIIGVLYIKDLLPHFEKENFEWNTLLRQPFFVPENKKLDNLLMDFKHNKTHLAIVVDEYGGTSGIITLEDILEEIVGEINDEFDVEEVNYSKLDERNFVFEGRVHLRDIYRILSLDETEFEASKGESETLAGFLIEREGKIPSKDDVLQFNGLSFKIEAADTRKIKRIKITLPA